MQKIKVMIVEDELIIAINIQRQLMMSVNLNVMKPIAKGEKAVEVAKTERPDLILMDILLANKMNGVEAAREILNVYDPVIVFASGFIDDEDISEQINDLHAYKLRKPYEAETVKRMIEEIF